MIRKFADINAVEFENAERQKDILWMLPYISVNTRTIETTEVDNSQIQPLGLGYDTVVMDTAYLQEMTYMHGGAEYTHRSAPVVMHSHRNVNTVQAEIWYAKLRIQEVTIIENGSTIEYVYGSGPFLYYNPKISIGCGTRSEIIYAEPAGRLHKDSLLGALGFHQEIAMSLASHLIAMPTGSEFVIFTYSSLLSIIQSLVGTSTEIVIGSGYSTVVPNKITKVHSISADRCYLKECTNQDGLCDVGDYLRLEVYVECMGGTGTTSEQGAINISCEIYNLEDGSVIPFEKSYVLNYSATTVD